MRGVSTVVVGLLAVLAARSALARETVCTHLAVDADASIQSKWPELPARVRQQFDGRNDIDTCAHVRLVATNPSIRVEVVLRDGRSATQSVSHREDIVPTVAALLLVPRMGQEPAPSPKEKESVQKADVDSSAQLPPGEEGSAPTQVTDASTSSAPLVPSSSPATTTERDSPAALRSDRTDREDHLRIELSVLAGARIGDGQRSGGGGALSFLDIGGWLVGFEGRADRYETLAGTPSGPALELAVLGGRRFHVGALALDFTAGFAGAVQGTVTHETPTASESSSSVAPRLLVGSRLDFGARSVLRGFVGIDAEAGPPRASSDADFPDAPRLPRWTVGLALGATMGTL